MLSSCRDGLLSQTFLIDLAIIFLWDLQLLAHNIFLAAVSLVMFIGLMASIASVFLRNTIWTVWWDQTVNLSLVLFVN